MEFTLTVPKNWNYTPSDLMRKYAKDNPRYTFTYDHFFTSVLHDNKTDINYYYDHLTREINNVNHTETVTVFLKRKGATLWKSYLKSTIGLIGYLAPRYLKQ